jgi:serine/threonine protein kinase
VLIDARGVAKVCDFNLARVVCNTNKYDLQEWTMTGGVGSYRYMAPELYVRAHEDTNYAIYGQACDVYSAAMVIYFMVTGDRPFATLSPIRYRLFATLSPTLHYN